MARIKKGLWYYCKESFGQFVKGYYYYCDEDNTLMVKAHKPTYVWPEDRKHFNKGEVIRIADVVRKNAEFDLLGHLRKKFHQALKKAAQGDPVGLEYILTVKAEILKAQGKPIPEIEPLPDDVKVEVIKLT